MSFVLSLPSWFSGISFAQSRRNPPESPAQLSVSLPLAHLQLHRPCDGVHFWVVVFIRSRLQRASPDGILGAETIVHRHRATRRDGIEIQDGLRSGHTE